MKQTIAASILGISILMIAGCGEIAEPVKTVDWYKDPANKESLVDVLRKNTEAKENNPGQYKETPNYINAKAAVGQMITNSLFLKIATTKDIGAYEDLMADKDVSNTVNDLKNRYTQEELILFGKNYTSAFPASPF